MTKNYTKFKIFPKKYDKFYYDVCIFKDKVSMRKFSTELFPAMGKHRFEAATHSFKAYKTVKGKEQLSDMIGTVLFYKGGFGVGVVAHEIAHAANYYFVNRGDGISMVDKTDKDWLTNDENYALCIGYMNNQFWKKCGFKPGKERY